MARCPECRQEVVLARACPYCGAAVPQPDGEASHVHAESQGEERGRARRATGGRLVGAMPGQADGPQTPFQRVSTFLRYMRDPSVPKLRKLFITLMGAYIVWPFDLITDLVPVVGWLDDIGVAAFLFNYVNAELGAYVQDKRSRGR